jgi:DNA-binding LytR/AlgR family response regulator
LSSNRNISCIIVDDEPIAREVIATHLTKIKNINIVACCSNAIEAFNIISNHTIDLVFLDINMPEISGISFAKSINSEIKIIFTTAYREYAVEGFELQAVDYLLKPISFERLLKAVNTYFKVYNNLSETIFNHTESNNFMFVRSDRRMLKIAFSEIVYIESYSDYIKVHLEDKTTIVTRETISAVEAKLPKREFIRIHRSYIIAVNYIDSFTNEQIVISGKSLPISRSYKKEVIVTLQQF